MAVRVLLVVVAFAVLYGCDQEGSPVVAQEAGAERSAPSSEPQPLPDQSSQEAALQAYFDRMSTLLLDEGLDGAIEDGANKGNREVRALARARTLAALEGLDPARKRLVMQFLVEASLVQNAPGEEPVMGLIGADLSGVDLTYSAPGDAQPYAAVPVLDLSSADLTYADLSGADLGIVMHGTRLVGADLRSADLNGAVIQDANLSGANLSGVTGKTAEQLDGQAGSLEGAIMPDGRKYEEWLKDEGGGAEDQGNNGSS
jgi:uncharacterized protein YjbI with pentapeptide repeats